MAKKNKTEGKAEKGAPENKRQSPTQKASEGFKYTVADLAKELGIQDTSVRVQLRNKDVPKNGAVYGWNSEKDFKEVVKILRGDKGKSKD